MMIELDNVPELVDPILIAAFEGWNDAGDAATAAVEHLQLSFDALLLGEVDPEDYYDFQVNRPVMVLAGEDRHLEWPATTIGHFKLPNGQDIIVVRGVEPNMRWRSYCDDLIEAATELGVTMVITLGALLADLPHSRPVQVTTSTSNPEVAEELDIDLSRYEGPTGIVGVLQDMCLHAGIPGLSIWTSVPHYVAQPPSPKSTLALIKRLEDILDATIPHGELPDDARAWERGVDELAAEDNDIADYVQSLEEAQDTAELPEASGEAIAREFERYLRHRNEGPRSQ